MTTVSATIDDLEKERPHKMATEPDLPAPSWCPGQMSLLDDGPATTAELVALAVELDPVLDADLRAPVLANLAARDVRMIR